MKPKNEGTLCAADLAVIRETLADGQNKENELDFGQS